MVRSGNLWGDGGFGRSLMIDEKPNLLCGLLFQSMEINHSH